MKITIKELEINMFLGIHEREKELKTKILIDIELLLSVAELKHKNNLADFIDYDVLASQIKDNFENTNYDLIEDLIFTLQKLIYETEPKATNVLIRVFKFGTRADVKSICIEESFTHSLNAKRSLN